MAAEYSRYSPYFETRTFGRFLDVLDYRSIPRSVSDIPYRINSVYQYRPDLLANDLYGSSNLWWVFAARNPNVIRDPIFDFYSGQTIMVPDRDIIKSTLGL